MASESLFDAWEMYKALLRSCPSHSYFGYIQISMFIKGTTDENRRMINASAGGYYVNGTTTKVKKIIEYVVASERGHDCNYTSPKDVSKKDIEDESLKQQTQMKAMKENVTKSIVKQLQPLIPPKQPILSSEEYGDNHHTSYYTEKVARKAKFMRECVTKLGEAIINLRTTSYSNLENTVEVINSLHNMNIYSMKCLTKCLDG